MFAFNLCFNFVHANNTIVFIDMNKILTKSVHGASLLKQFNELNNENLADFNKIANQLKEEEKKLSLKKNILSDVEFKDKVNELRLKIKKFNDNRNKSTKEFNNIKIKQTNSFLKLINPLLVTYSEENSISLILKKKNLIIGKRELDITDIIIELVNMNIKEIKIK